MRRKKKNKRRAPYFYVFICIGSLITFFGLKSAADHSLAFVIYSLAGITIFGLYIYLDKLLPKVNISEEELEEEYKKLVSERIKEIPEEKKIAFEEYQELKINFDLEGEKFTDKFRELGTELDLLKKMK